jgi:hypothetical protein
MASIASAIHISAQALEERRGSTAGAAPSGAASLRAVLARRQFGLIRSYGCLMFDA